jgi:hypothetical protein
MKREITENQRDYQKHNRRGTKTIQATLAFQKSNLIKELKGIRPSASSGVFCHELEVFQIPAISIARRATSKAKPGQVIIFHDGFDAKGGDRKQTVEAVKLTVREFNKKGYTFEKL